MQDDNQYKIVKTESGFVAVRYTGEIIPIVPAKLILKLGARRANEVIKQEYWGSVR